MPRQSIHERRQFVTVRQVCEDHQISERTVYRYIQQGKLKPYRVGPKMIRFDVDEVECALIGQR